jgi:hypothetical protein
MVFPPISASGFPGNRVEAHRAGMIPAIFMCLFFYNYLIFTFSGFGIIFGFAIENSAKTFSFFSGFPRAKARGYECCAPSGHLIIYLACLNKPLFGRMCPHCFL